MGISGLVRSLRAVPCYLRRVREYELLCASDDDGGGASGGTCGIPISLKTTLVPHPS